MECPDTEHHLWVELHEVLIVVVAVVMVVISQTFPCSDKFQRERVKRREDLFGHVAFVARVHA